MALNKAVETNYGVIVDGCYLRVEQPKLTKTALSFHLRTYVDITKPFFEETVFTCAYDIAGENPFKQAYTHLKTLPEFADATDV